MFENSPQTEYLNLDGPQLTQASSCLSSANAHAGEHPSVTNKQRFRRQHTNPSEHLYAIKLGMFLKDVCVCIVYLIDWNGSYFCPAK